MTAPVPYMMKVETAAQYCDLSRSAFLGEVATGRLPTAVNLGGKDHWFRPSLEKALARIAGDLKEEHEERFWNRGATA